MLASSMVGAVLISRAVDDGLEAGSPEVLVDGWTREVKAGLSDDQNLIYPGIEAEFNAAVAS